MLENIFCIIIAAIVVFTALRLEKLEKEHKKAGYIVNSRDYRFGNAVKNTIKSILRRKK